MDERLNGATVVASVSGGKDSAALSLWLTEQGIEHRRVFADTGWEHKWTYEYLAGPLTQALGVIDTVKGKHGGMAEVVLNKAMFPSRLRRFCTEELKLKPIVGFIDALQNKGHTVVNAIGIRAAESQARKNLPEWEWSEQADCWVWRPLIRWTEADVIAIHAKHGLKPNPLYLAGATRVGCWPCVFARKAEIKVIAELSPERIAEIEALEAEVTARAIARLERKRSAGEVSEEEYAVAMANMPRTFFHGRGSRTLVPAPIASVVEWSRTGRGGKQLLLFDDQPSGCVRWGLCEANTEGVQE